MRESGPDEIQKLFEALRAADQASAPALRELLGPSSRPRPEAWRLLRPAVAIVALLVIVSAALLIRLNSPRAVTPAALSEWRSPTEFLLSAGADNLLSQSPRLGDYSYPTSALSVFGASQVPRPVDRNSGSQKAGEDR